MAETYKRKIPMKKPMLSKLDTAQTLAARGFKIFPITENEKCPPLIHWSNPEKDGGPTTDPVRISQWWTQYPNANIGIATGPSNLLVVDIDIKNGKQGEKALMFLSLLYGMPEETFRVSTPSGGSHFYFQVENAVKGSIDFMKDEIGTGVDSKCKGGYVLAPGSQTFVGPYECTDLDAGILPAPEFLLVPQKTHRADANDHPPGQFSPKQLEEMLDCLDPTDHRNHDDWFEVMCASHHATGGYGKREFIWWSTSDPMYRNHLEKISKRWDSLKSTENSITAGTLIHHVRQAGGKIPGPVFEKYVETETESSKSPPKRFMTLQDLKDLTPPKWLIQGLLAEESVMIIFGQPGTYKTFFSLHIGLCISNGMRCFGRKVEQGDVIYLAGEGPLGFKLRTEAWEIFHKKQMNASPFFIQLGGNPLNIQNEVEKLLRDIQKQDIHPKVIIIDTLQIYLDGNENGAEDMGDFVRACHKLRDATGASIIIVHHLGKDEARGPRGHTALIGAADAIFKMTKQGEHSIVECIKMKEANDQIKIALIAQKISLDIKPESTEAFTDSLVLIETDFPVKTETEQIRTLAMKFDGKFIKDLKAKVAEELGCSLSTAKRKIELAIGEGEAHAVFVEEGRMWLEPHLTNPRGPISIRYQQSANWEYNEDFL